MRDEDLTELLYERSEEAVRMLSDRYGTIFLKQALNILKNREDAEECVNDMYLSLWNSIPPARPDSLLAYASRILRNQALSRLRQENAEKRPVREEYVNEENDPLERIASAESVEDEVISKELEETIDLFLEGQPELNRMIFVRRYWYLDSYEELSRLSGLSQVALRARLSRMRREMRQFLRKKGVLE